jgi:hypothetical protein
LSTPVCDRAPFTPGYGGKEPTAFRKLYAAVSASIGVSTAWKYSIPPCMELNVVPRTGPPASSHDGCILHRPVTPDPWPVPGAATVGPNRASVDCRPPKLMLLYVHTRQKTGVSGEVPCALCVRTDFAKCVRHGDNHWRRRRHSGCRRPRDSIVGLTDCPNEDKDHLVRSPRGRSRPTRAFPGWNRLA